jgi:hypothetical protein
MQRASIFVHADWDADAQVWVATSSDIDGLAVEAATIEQLSQKVISAVGDLIEANGGSYSVPDIPVHIMAQQIARIPNPGN